MNYVECLKVVTRVVMFPALAIGYILQALLDAFNKGCQLYTDVSTIAGTKNQKYYFKLIDPVSAEYNLKAIQTVRRITGFSLKRAKDWVEGLDSEAVLVPSDCVDAYKNALMNAGLNVEVITKRGFI